jgi:hypothetical protein
VAFIVAQILSWLWLLAVGPLAMLLMVVANTGRGHLFAGAALFTAILPLVATVAARKRVQRWTIGTIFAGAGWLVLVD